MNITNTRYTAIILCLFIINSCSEDDGQVTETHLTYEGTININPNNFPKGGGLSLIAGDTGRVVQVDADPDFDWDILVITYRTAAGGRPGILLKGDETTATAVKAVDVSSMSSDIGLGEGGFNDFENITQEMIDALEPDGVFNFDPEVDVDGMGKAIESVLLDAYDNLVIGNKTVNLEAVNQPVYLIEIVSGEYFKFQLASRESGGATTLRWSRIAR